MLTQMLNLMDNAISTSDIINYYSI